MIYKGVPYQIV